MNEDYTLRSYVTEDKKELYRICLLCDPAGAAGRYSQTELIGHIYAGPYGEYSPEFCVILADRFGRACGYCIGALDSRLFYDRLKKEWFPPIIAEYDNKKDARFTDDDRRLLDQIRDFSYPIPKELEPYPSHLHIDLLPEYQNRSIGGGMIDALLQRFCSAGSPGVHLGVGTRNERAIRFYEKKGFAPVRGNAGRNPEGCVVMARTLAMDNGYL